MNKKKKTGEMPFNHYSCCMGCPPEGTVGNLLGTPQHNTTGFKGIVVLF